MVAIGEAWLACRERQCDVAMWWGGVMQRCGATVVWCGEAAGLAHCGGVVSRNGGAA